MSSQPMQAAEAAAQFLSEHWPTAIDTVVVTGSGFSVDALGRELADPISYRQVPGMPVGTVEGHAHMFRLLRVHERIILLCSGRLHLYEGLTAEECGIFMHIAGLMNVKRAVLMNAVGGLNPLLSVGDIVLVDDILDLTLSKVITKGPRHRTGGPSMEWCDTVMHRCLESGFRLHRGVLAQMLGPSYETRAEVRMLRKAGADVVGMSTAIEAQQAWRFGIDTVILSLVTNMLSDVALPTLDHHDVLTAARSASTRLQHALNLALA